MQRLARLAHEAAAIGQGTLRILTLSEYMPATMP